MTTVYNNTIQECSFSNVSLRHAQRRTKGGGGEGDGRLGRGNLGIPVDISIHEHI